MRDAIWYSTQKKMYRGWREYANQAKCGDADWLKYE